MAFGDNGLLRLAADASRGSAATVIGYYSQVRHAGQQQGLLVAVKETGSTEDLLDLRPLLLGHVGHGLWRRAVEKRTVFISDPPHEQALNLFPADVSDLRFQVLWCHPGRAPAALYLREDGMVEFSSELCRQNTEKKNGTYIIKYTDAAAQERPEQIEELEVCFHHDGVSSQAKTTILHRVNDNGVFRAVGNKTNNGKRKYYQLEWEGEQMKTWHVVAILQPIQG